MAEMQSMCPSLKYFKPSVSLKTLSSVETSDPKGKKDSGIEKQ